jgi:mRNA interferase MazF
VTVATNHTEPKKPKKVKESTKLSAKTSELLNDLRLIIENMDEKRGEIYLDWLQTQNKYLVWEENFDPLKLRKFNRGEIVFANFGFNVGSEYGGMHYAVILDKNKKSNPMVNVVPLTSLKGGYTKVDIHSGEVFLGEIAGLNDKQSIAIINQKRPISKLRIFKPRSAKDNVFKLSDDQMDLIDEKVRKMFTKTQL